MMCSCVGVAGCRSCYYNWLQSNPVVSEERRVKKSCEAMGQDRVAIVTCLCSHIK